MNQKYICKKKQSTDALWLELWSDALRLVLLGDTPCAFSQQFEGFFSGFKVDPENCRIFVDGKPYEKATLTTENAQPLRDIIKEGFDYYEMYKVRLAQAQRAAAELEETKKAAMAKLTPAELKALGVELPNENDF